MASAVLPVFRRSSTRSIYCGRVGGQPRVRPYSRGKLESSTNIARIWILSIPSRSGSELGLPTSVGSASERGVCGFVVGAQNFTELLTLESVSPGMPRTAWELPLPEYCNFAIYPRGATLCFAERRAGKESLLESHTHDLLTSYSGYGVHLWSVTSGLPHSGIEDRIIGCPQTRNKTCGRSCPYIHHESRAHHPGMAPRHRERGRGGCLA